MGLKRIGSSTPTANTPTTLYTADTHYLASVIATNKSASTQTISIWIEPSGATQESDNIYMIKDFPLDGNNSYETFRFATNINDSIKVESTSSSTSFSAYGIIQVDIKIKLGTSTYSSTAPLDPIEGMIWVDADGTVPNNSDSKPTYVWSGSSWIPMSAAQPTLNPAHIDIILAQRMFG